MSDTDCRNCKAPMPKPPLREDHPFLRIGTFQVTAYRCEACGHWNDLKRRKKKEPTP